MCSLEVDSLVCSRDKAYIFSGYKENIERAHILASSEYDWFIRGNMERYNLSSFLVLESLVEDPSNSLTLRCDIHKFFDNGSFVILCKEEEWVIHFLTPTDTLGPKYHNNIVKLPGEVQPPFLLAHLARAVFPKIAPFLIAGGRRLVSLTHVDTTGDSVVIRVKDADNDRLSTLIGYEPDPSTGPEPNLKKRTRTVAGKD